MNHSFDVSRDNFDGFDICSAKSFTHNGNVNMVAPRTMQNKSFNMKRHIARNHDVRLNEKSYDVRLKENFKLFVTGPSRCGKTVFIAKLLENIHAFAKLPPTKVVYV